MPIRRVNSTGRQRIDRSDVAVVVHVDAEGVLEFDATMDLAEYELPADALVFVEAYRQTTFMRFSHGTVAAPVCLPGVSRRLTDFASSERILFRVKVTSSSGRFGLLLAEADQIPVNEDEEQPEYRMPLLPPRPEDLGQEVWRVDFSGADGPYLLINQRVGDWKALARAPTFRAFAYPAAMRQTLWRVHKIEKVYHSDDPDDWRSRWLSFAESLPGVGEVPNEHADDEDVGVWIDSAIDAFCRKHSLFDRYKVLPESEETA